MMVWYRITGKLLWPCCGIALGLLWKCYGLAVLLLLHVEKCEEVYGHCNCIALEPLHTHMHMPHAYTE